MVKPVKITEKKVSNALAALEQEGQIKEGAKIATKAVAKLVAQLIVGDGVTPTSDERDMALSYLQSIAVDRKEAAMDDGEAADEGSRSKVAEKYKRKYADTDTKTGCADEVDVAFRAATTGLEGDDLLAKLQEIAVANNIDADRYNNWTKIRNRDGGINVGMVRMNLSNVLRGMNRKGERVTIGKANFKADPTKQAATKAKKQAGLDKLKQRAAGKNKPKGKAKGQRPPASKKIKAPAQPAPEPDTQGIEEEQGE